jgi:hypothetical protein
VEANFLRRLSQQELGGGRGNRIRYGFDHLIELGVALFGVERGARLHAGGRRLNSQSIDTRPQVPNSRIANCASALTNKSSTDLR